MKKIVINYLFCLSLLIIVLPAQSQLTPDQLVSADTLIAGDTTMILSQCGFFDDYTGIMGGLIPLDFPDPLYFPDYVYDTLWNYETIKYNDTIAEFHFYIPPGTYPGRYMLFICDQYHSLISDYESLFILSKPYFILQPENNQTCPGDTFQFEVKTIDRYDAIYQWFHNDLVVEDAYNRVLKIYNTQLSDTGYYFCIATNYYGIDTSGKARLDFYPVPDKPVVPEGIPALCFGTESSVYCVENDPEVINYKWSLHPPSAGSLSAYDTSVTITWDDAFTGTAKIHVTPQGEFCEGKNSDTLDIMITGPPQQPEICIVGIDEETGRNRIVWGKIDDHAIVSYLIYRETNQSDIYLLLDSVPSGEFSIYIDSGSLPGVVSQRYKISILDTCGNESDLSNAHKTMHLTSNIGTHGEVNLIWEHYEGFAFLSYNIYRGTHPDSLEYLTSVPSNVSLYTDQYPPEGNIYYQIGIIHPEGCNPSKKAADYSISRSNIIHVETTGINILPEISDFRIFPNPADETLIIFSIHTNPVVTRLYNSSGMQIREFYLEPGQNILTISELPEGIYFLNVIQNKKCSKASFIKLK
jgi:hypothetical protein